LRRYSADDHARSDHHNHARHDNYHQADNYNNQADDNHFKAPLSDHPRLFAARFDRNSHLQQSRGS
jgi:hypothetical protein